jgi:copper transport protein
LEWVFARWLSYVATLLIGGICVVGLGVLPRAVDATGALERVTFDLRRIGWLALGAMLLASALRLTDQVLALQSPEDAPLSGVATLLASTTWGTGFLAQQLAWLLALVGCSMLGRPATRAAWSVLFLGAAGLCIAPSLQGHAIGDENYPLVALLADVTHMSGATGWLGAIAVIGVLGFAIPDADGVVLPERERRARDRLLLLVPLVPPVALTGAALLVGSGVASTVIHLQLVSDLWTSAWGRYVLVKVVVVALVALAGALNWRRYGPKAQFGSGVKVLRRMLVLELSLALFALVVTALLVVTPLPGE